jgi:photosystem II stability/assembly factor-like uncharacterized protein
MHSTGSIAICLAGLALGGLRLTELATPSLAQETRPALSWTMQESGTTAGLRGIYSVDGQVAWASGTEGTVLRTTDGGGHWTRCATPDAATDGATLDFRGIQAWDEKAAIVMASGPGEKSRLYKTVDGCRTWELVFKNPDAPEGFWDSVHVEGFDAVMIGDPVKGRFSVFVSDQRGLKDWHRFESPQRQPNLRLPAPHSADEGLFAASNSNVWGSGYHGVSFITGGPMGSFLYQTEWHSWPTDFTFARFAIHKLPLAKGTSAGAFSAFWKAPCNHNIRGDCSAIVVGGDYTKPNDPTGTAAWSADGGQHWTAATTPPHGYRSTVQYSPDLKAWITAGTNGSDISHDDGKTWESIDNGNWNALSLPFLVGPKGRIARLSVAAGKP